MSPRFSLRPQELRQTVAALPTDVAARVDAEPRRFLDLLADALAAPDGALTLVDKAHGLDPSSVPDDLVDLAGGDFALAKGGLRLRAVVLDDLAAMNAAARAEGIVLTVSSTFRSYDQQQALWNRALGTQERALVERELAPPGHSQHQLGTAVDFGSIDDSFATTAAGRWMAANAWGFGWSLSYPEGREAQTGYRWESWHFRWIGRPGAELVHDFFAGDQQAFLEFIEASGPALRAKRRADG